MMRLEVSSQLIKQSSQAAESFVMRMMYERLSPWRTHSHARCVKTVSSAAGAICEREWGLINLL